MTRVTRMKSTYVPPTPEQAAARALAEAGAAWRRVLDYSTPHEFALIQSKTAFDGLRGLAHVSDGWRGYYVTVRRAGEEVTIHIDLTRDHGARIANPFDQTQRACPMLVEAKLTWSSTGRPIAACTAAIELYRECAARAAEAEQILRDLRPALYDNVIHTVKQEVA